MTNYEKILNDIKSFKKIPNPLYKKYYLDKKLIRYDQRRSLKKKEIMVDYVSEKSMIFTFNSTNLNRSFGFVKIEKDLFNKNKTIYIIIRLRHGQQRSEDIKHFYSSIMLSYDKDYKLKKIYGMAIEKRLHNEALQIGNKIIKKFIKYMNTI
jgi:hypothetical protein